MSIKDKTILIVDDDDEIIILLTKIFEAQGMRTISAKNLTEAKSVISTTQPHLVILDIKLEKENGLTFLSFLKNSPLGINLPVIVFSRIDNLKIIKLAQAAGADDFINKPVIASQLLQKVRKHIASSKIKNYFFVDYLKNPISLQVQGYITKYNQNFVIMKTKVKINELTKVYIKSKFCDQVGFSAGTFIVKGQVTIARNGMYLHTLYYVGINQKTIENILKLRE